MLIQQDTVVIFPFISHSLFLKATYFQNDYGIFCLQNYKSKNQPFENVNIWITFLHEEIFST